MGQDHSFHQFAGHWKAVEEHGIHEYLRSIGTPNHVVEKVDVSNIKVEFDHVGGHNVHVKEHVGHHVSDLNVELHKEYEMPSEAGGVHYKGMFTEENGKLVERLRLHDGSEAFIVYEICDGHHMKKEMQHGGVRAMVKFTKA